MSTPPHLVEIYLAMKNIASKIFQKITCTLGVKYNANARHMHIDSLIYMVVFLAVYKVSLIKFLQEFIVVVGGGISYINWEVF